jgi:formylglycine-generating enzyme required for sulfatase activity
MAVRTTGKTFPRWALVALSRLLAVFVVAQACQVVGGYQSFEPGDGAAPHPCDVLPSSKVDEKGLAPLVLSKQPDGTCYWIGKTEVTVQEYEQFLMSSARPIDWDAKLCAWKTAPSDPASVQAANDPCTLSTSVEADPFRLTKPIRCVDWCDAKALCTWAGMDLCGGITNGSFVGPSDVPDQWGGACSANGWPYVSGTMPVAGQCNVGLSEDAGQCYSALGQPRCAPTDVGSFRACVSPSGAEDMIGNVAEWVKLCGNSDGGPGTLCQHRGGSFAGNLDDETCYVTAADGISTRDRGLGLRCCATLTAAEQALLK